MAVGYVNNPVGRKIQTRLLGHRPDARLRPHQHRRDHAGLRRFDGARQGNGIAGMYHGRGDRLQPLHRCQQRRVAVVVTHRDLRQVDVAAGLGLDHRMLGPVDGQRLASEALEQVLGHQSTGEAAGAVEVEEDHLGIGRGAHDP